MAEAKKKAAPAKKAAPKKKEVDLSLASQNEMSRENYKRIYGDKTSYNRRQRHPGRGQR